MPTTGKNIPLALTSGEPAGVGPLLTAALWQQRKTLDLPPFVFIGSAAALTAHTPNIAYECITAPSEAYDLFTHAIPVLDCPTPHSITPGVINSATTDTVIQAIDTAVRLTQSGETSAVVTNPIHKASLYSHGFSFAGHTDYLAHLCGVDTRNAVMMLMAQNLRVVPVTIHIPLHAVAQTLTCDAIVHAGMTVASDLRDRFGIAKPRLAITGLNPHAGEEGTIGLEEATHILPAIRTLKDMGLLVSGPHAADTLFHEDARAHYDCVIAMYHDQALIPVKTLDFYGGVNVTLGLPIIRSSPDHGTALERAQQGDARSDSLLAALRTAQSMVERST